MSPAYLNVGDPNGTLWIPAETDVSIRPGWFYHEEEDSKVKSPKELVDLYYQSVGRNSLLLLNIPPNKQGVFSAIDVKNLYDFRAILDETFKNNFAVGNVKGALTDKALSSFVTLKKGKPYVMNFKTEIAFDRISLQENIAEGQRNAKALMEYWDGKTWKMLHQFTTIGHKRLLRIPLIKTSKVRVTVQESKGAVQLAEIGFYKASTKE